MPVEIHQIAEHHREIAPLTSTGSFRKRRHSCRCRRARRRSRRVVEVGDRAQHFAPITEENAQLLQVMIGQIGQDREINAVFGKGLRVLGHAELLEPIRYQLHRGPSHEDEGIREFIR